MEKFAYMNLINALSALSGLKKAQNEKKTEDNPPAAEKSRSLSALEEVLLRHEKIANRVRSKK